MSKTNLSLNLFATERLVFSTELTSLSLGDEMGLGWFESVNMNRQEGRDIWDDDTTGTLCLLTDKSHFILLDPSPLLPCSEADK